MRFSARCLPLRGKVKTEEDELAELKEGWKFNWENGKLRCGECGKKMRNKEINNHSCGIQSDIPVYDFPPFSPKKPFWWERGSEELPKPPKGSTFRKNYFEHSQNQRPGKKGRRDDTQPPPSSKPVPLFPSISRNSESELESALQLHTQKWNKLITQTAPVVMSSIPWPTDVIKLLPLVSEQRRKSIARELLFRFHPDKFITSIQHLSLRRAADTSEIRATASDIAKQLTAIK